MRLSVKPPGKYIARAKQRIRQLLNHPGVEKWAKRVGICLCGFILSAAGSGVTPMPLAVGLLCCLDFGLETLLACGASVGGTLLFWGMDAGLEPAALLLIVFALLALLEGLAVKGTRLFVPLLVSAVTATVGILFLLEGSFTSRGDLSMFLLRVGLSGLSAAAFTQYKRSRNSPAGWFAAGAFAMGLAQILLFGYLDLGAAFGALLVCAAPPGLASLPMAAVCGVSLDLSGISAVPFTPIYCLGSLFSAVLPKKQVRFFLLPALCFPIMLLCSAYDLMVPVSLAVGSLAALLHPRSLIPQPIQEIPGAEPDTAVRLQAVAKVLGMIQSLLLTESREGVSDSAALVFDQATDQVCRSCLHFSQCWERNGSETYRLLRDAAPGLLEKGTAQISDLPVPFLDRCRRPEPFLEAVNQALFAHRYGAKCQAQLAESRMVLCSQYQFLADYLSQTAEALESPIYACADRRYRPEIGIGTAGKYGLAVSGDRGACFAGPGSMYYVLLCDGMGTGPGAAAESESAMNLLTGLLQAGLSAGAALEMLNGVYLLRNSGGFSTADLLELHLDSGRALLYKWGAAPSYVKHQGYAKKVGTAAPPPGLGLGGACRAEVIRLSLTRGETVILVSDGVSGEETRQRIAGFADPSPKALASYIIAGTGQNGEEGEDDRTAVAVCLRPLTPKVT